MKKVVLLAALTVFAGEVFARPIRMPPRHPTPQELAVQPMPSTQTVTDTVTGAVVPASGIAPGVGIGATQAVQAVPSLGPGLGGTLEPTGRVQPVQPVLPTIDNGQTVVPPMTGTFGSFNSNSLVPPMTGSFPTATNSFAPLNGRFTTPLTNRFVQPMTNVPHLGPTLPRPGAP